MAILIVNSLIKSIRNQYLTSPINTGFYNSGIIKYNCYWLSNYASIKNSNFIRLILNFFIINCEESSFACLQSLEKESRENHYIEFLWAFNGILDQQNEKLIVLLIERY